MTSAPHTRTQNQVTGGGSALTRYRRVMVGRDTWGALLYYEWALGLSILPGALGLGLRQACWRRLFRRCGKGTQFGARIQLMHPNRIALGARVVVADACVLDARSPDHAEALSLGDDTILSHGVMLSAKGGAIAIGARAGIGAYTVMHATEGNPLTIGDDVAIGPQVYITGGGNYRMDRLDIPISKQPLEATGGCRIESGVWLGARASVLGGLTIGRDSVIGAGAVVTRSIPERSIAVGVPARVVGRREGAGS